MGCKGSTGTMQDRLGSTSSMGLNGSCQQCHIVSWTFSNKQLEGMQAVPCCTSPSAQGMQSKAADAGADKECKQTVRQGPGTGGRGRGRVT